MNLPTALQELLAKLQASAECFHAAGHEMASPQLSARLREWGAERECFSAALVALAGTLSVSAALEPIAAPAFPGFGDWQPGLPWHDDEALLLQCEKTELATLAAYEQFLHQPALGDDLILLVHDQYLQIRAACEVRLALRRDSLVSV